MATHKLPSVQARFAVVDALRSWLEGGWRPELIPTLFVASEAPASFDLPPTIAQVCTSTVPADAQMPAQLAHASVAGSVAN